MPPKGKRKYPVTADKVIPSLWKTAMQLAGGDGTRIHIVSISQVIIDPPKKAGQ